MKPEVRRTRYAFPREQPPAWAGSDWLTHLMDAFNLMAPSGEAFVVRVVREHLDAAEEPFFRDLLKAFIGQESQHATQHRKASAGLAAGGFPVEDFAGWWDGIYATLRDRLSPEMQVAVVAAMEHFAAVIGELGLRSAHTPSIPEPYRSLLEWHAAEEIEHKDLAFDLLERVDPSHWLRAKGLVVASAVLFAGYARSMSMLLRHTGAWRRWRTWFDAGDLYWGRERFAARWSAAMLDYLRPDFHPRQYTADLPLAEAALARQAGAEAFRPAVGAGTVQAEDAGVSGDEHA